MSGPQKPGSGAVASAGKGVSKKVLDQLKKLAAAEQEEKSTYSIPDLGITFAADIAIDRLKVLEDNLRRVTSRGATFAKGGALHKAFQSTAEVYDRMAGSADMGATAVKALVVSMEQFSQMAEGGKAGLQFVEQMSQQAAALDRFGLSFSDYAKNVDLAQNMLNMSKEAVLGLNQGLADFSKEMRLLPGLVSQNFQLVAKSLSYEGPKIVEQFKKIQTMSSQTGVSVGTLMSGMGDRLDTFSGAGQFAAQLNAILGGNVFSPNEILMMDESERIIRIREEIRKHPIMGEIEKGGRLGKFALNTISKVVGFSKEDTRKYLTGDFDPSKKPAERSAKEAAAATIGGGFTKETSGLFKKATGEFSETAIKLKGTVDQLNKQMEQNAIMIKNAYLSVQDRALVEERARYMGGRKAGAGDIFSKRPGSDAKLKGLQDEFLRMQGLKNISRFGVGELVGTSGGLFAGTGVTQDEIKIAQSRLPELDSLLNSLQTLPMDNQPAKKFRNEVASLIKVYGKRGQVNIGKRTQQQLSGLMQLDKEVSRPFQEANDLISQKEAAALVLIKGSALKTQRLGAYNKALRLFRMGGDDKDNTQKLLDELERLELDENTTGEDKKTLKELRESIVKLTPEGAKKIVETSGQQAAAAAIPGSQVASAASPGQTPGASPLSTIEEAAFDKLIAAFSKLTLEIPLGNGEMTKIVGATLKRNGVG